MQRYSVKQLADMAGVTPRTLRYYDHLGLLRPAEVSESGYRSYGAGEVDRLQHILLYREMGVPLRAIVRLLDDPAFDAVRMLEEQLETLRENQERLGVMIATLTKSILAAKGEIAMNDSEKFEGFKRELVAENERRYGGEIREKYGDDAVERSNQKVLGMSAEAYRAHEELTEQLSQALKEAVAQGDPAGEPAQRACALHKQWLCQYWEQYSAEAHRNLCQMYVEDERFRAYYEAIAPGCAQFLRDAMEIFLQK